MLALPRQLFADRPIAIMNYREKQVNDYGQMGRHHERGEHNFDRLYPELKDNGAYSEWAWGLSRLIDGLQQLGPEVTKIDIKHIGVSGCSYAGKMALYCGAFDERIALTIAQEPGGGGAAAWRTSHESTLKGKNLEDLDKTDYHWFMESQKENFHGDSVYRWRVRRRISMGILSIVCLMTSMNSARWFVRELYCCWVILTMSGWLMVRWWFQLRLQRKSGISLVSVIALVIRLLKDTDIVSCLRDNFQKCRLSLISSF